MVAVTGSGRYADAVLGVELLPGKTTKRKTTFTAVTNVRMVEVVVDLVGCRSEALGIRPAPSVADLQPKLVF